MKKESNPPCELCKKNGLPNCGKPWCYTNQKHEGDEVQMLYNRKEFELLLEYETKRT